MSVCRATKRNGEPCTLPAHGPHGLCWAHNPENAEKRRRGASRGGRAKAGTEIRAIKARLSGLADDVLAGDVETGRAAVANQILNSVLRAIDLQRRVRESEEFEERLAALEREESVRWGA